MWFGRGDHLMWVSGLVGHLLIETKFWNIGNGFHSHFWNRWNIYLFGCSRCQPRFIDQKAGFESCLYLVIHSILRNSSPKLPNIHWCINISQRYNFNISVIEILSILQRHNIDILLKYYQYCKDIILIYYWNTIIIAKT